MREYHTPRVDAGDDGNLTDAVVRNARLHPEAIAFRVRHAADWVEVTAAGFRDDVVAAAKGLLALGVSPGDRVGLWCSTRYEWAVLDYAIWWVGGVSVPVYANAAPDQARAVLADAEVSVLLVETPDHRRVARELQADLTSLRSVWTLDDDTMAGLAAQGAALGDDELEQVRAAVERGSLASLVYTSGTTGAPRGCMLTHANFLEESAAALSVLGDLFDRGGAETLMMLPLPHVFARTVQVAAVAARVTLGHTARVVDLPEDLATFRPTFLLAVPRVFEQLFNLASQQAAADGWGRRFGHASDTAIAYSRALDAGRVGPALRARHALYERRVYPRLRGLLGGRCGFGVCGGAPLGLRLAHFYRGIGLPVLEGYGLTETTAAVTLNPPDSPRLGTVGPPLPGTAVRVSDDGELLVRGGQVMQGYWRAPEETSRVLDEDGWLRTGDVGEIDDQGNVLVSGRKREILVTAGGKSVAPEPLEERIRSHPLVSQCMVVGDGRPFLAALVTLDPTATTTWAAAHGVQADRLASDARLRQEVQAAVDDANTMVSQAESIRRFLVLPREWTEDAGELTPSLKLRRRVILGRLRHQIDELFTP